MPTGVRIPLRPFRSRARPPSVGALSRFMGAGRPGSAGPRAAHAAQGFRARCAGDESQFNATVRERGHLRWARSLASWAKGVPASPGRHGLGETRSSLPVQGEPIASLWARSPAAEDQRQVAAVNQTGAVDVGLKLSLPVGAPSSEEDA
jgi:hypothetical protein